MVGPSRHQFTQETAHSWADVEQLIFICGRYEGIDARVEQRCRHSYGEEFSKVSLGQFITLGGELPAMTMTEAVARLLPGVIKEQASRQDESYQPSTNMKNLEYPQYTRPETVEGMTVPEILLSGHHHNIDQRRKENTDYISS